MFELNECIKILDTESSRFYGNAKNYRTSLTGLITLGIGSLVALLALIKTDQVVIPNDLQVLIPCYTAILLISFGLFLLFQWYNMKILANLMGESDGMPLNKEALSSVRINGDPFVVIYNLSYLVAILTTLFTLCTLFSKSSFSLVLILIVWMTIFLFIFWMVHHIRKKGQMGLNISLRLLSNPLIFYPIAIGLLVTGFFFLVLISESGSVDNFIISLYMVELQIVIVQSLSFYKSQAENNLIAYRLDGLRYKLIHGEVKAEDFLSLHEGIFKKKVPLMMGENARELASERSDQA